MKRSYFKKTGVLILLIPMTFTLQSCLVSRCKRPQIVGYVYDSITRKPIENCKVGENLTDTNGYFQLKELRYSQFTFVGSEAPPLMADEPVYKENYEQKYIKLFSKYGSGNRKGSLHNADTIFLKRKSITADYK